jgi:hypothetical protein
MTRVYTGGWHIRHPDLKWPNFGGSGGEMATPRCIADFSLHRSRVRASQSAEIRGFGQLDTGWVTDTRTEHRTQYCAGMFYMKVDGGWPAPRIFDFAARSTARAKIR